MEVVVHKLDPHYRLYEDCLTYLETEYPVDSLTCSLPRDILDQPGLAHLHPSFGTLVNLLADRYPKPDLDNPPPGGLSVSFRRRSVIDFVLSEPPPFRTPTLSLNDLADEHSSAMRAARALVGSPMDIPWYEDLHDGYPFCSTLSAYTKIRRDGAIQSLRDDAWLWVSAMTFGVLEAVTRARLPEFMFVVPGPSEGGTVLSGTRILQFMVHWPHHMHHHRDTHDTDAHLEHGRDVARLLSRALNALDEEKWQNASAFFRAGYRTDEVTDMVCAVALTVAPLCAVAHNVWETLPEMDRLLERSRDKLRSYYTATLGSCEERMYRAGWCPNTVSHQFMSTLWGLSIVSNLVRLPPYIRSRPDEHKECTQEKCVFYTINTSTYKPRHVDPSCHCENIKPSLKDVIALLSIKDPRVPVVVYDGKELHVQPADTAPYVAISHVWADGMGSITEDGLPTCIVKRIAGLVQRLLPDTGAFWMDSLCVPGVRELKTRAIKLMSHTYRDSAKVLVIDDCIRSQCSERKTWEENLFRIATSGWVRRVWTLQEGLLARDLYFEFVEGPVNVEQRLGLLPSDSDDAANNAPVGADDSLSFLDPHSCPSHVPVLAHRARHRDCTHHLPLDDILRLLRLRTTTNPEDETIAISTLLPIDVDKLLKVDPKPRKTLAQRRVRKFLLLLGDVSKAFPTQITPCLELPGFSWAPRTLVSSLEGAPITSGTGVCTADGLTAEYHVAEFEKPVVIPAECRDGRKEEFSILLSQRASMATYWLRLYVGVGNKAAPRIDALLFLQGDLADTRTTVACAAVCRTGEAHVKPRNEVDEDREGSGQEATGAAEKQKLQSFSHVAPGRLHRMALHPDKFVPDDMSVLGELCQSMVLLT
ncbi:hypothetical protein TRAPUB_11096 [Trametes pubescens]|uniref:Heterokaryon incompatibility domain-containing protein n=1 Tax=Trametes pubescens TaxID=154538 RepID=A0A1M2VXI2_TRAPU|nr:hypothetical protein TRAPUB_11096 [Trametes pubescens]